AAGLQPGLRLREARRWFPQVCFVPAADEEYRDEARPALEIGASYTPLVDPETPARFFLDVTGCEALHGSPRAIAERLARCIPAETGFPCVVGGGRNRLIARLAAMQEDRPSGVRMIPAGVERRFLAPLPLSALGELIDPEMREWLALRGVNTFGEVALLPQGLLWSRFGVKGEQLLRLVLGKDSTPVRPAYPPGRVVARVECESFAPLRQEMLHCLSRLAELLSAQLRKKGEVARRFQLQLSLRGRSTLSAATLLPAPVGAMADIFETLLRLFLKMTPTQPPLEMTALAEEFTPGEAFQEALLPHPDRSVSPQRERRLKHALQLLAARFGPTAVMPGYCLRASYRPRFSDRVAMLHGGHPGE
ncbi:MAG: hypothetical protein QHJ73_09435, partial [Armatimonadota bacterium]|nr:hypothetical protein [Armatimonadota bacterium]